MIEIKTVELKSEKGKTNLGFNDIDLDNGDKHIKIELEEDYIMESGKKEAEKQVEPLDKQLEIQKEKNSSEDVNELEDKEADKEDNDHFISHFIIHIHSIVDDLYKNVCYF
jgi:hypothetical protein